MGVNQMPECEEDVIQQVESFIDDNRKISLQAIKDHGFDESVICDMMNVYFLGTSRILAALRKQRKANETMIHFLEEANRLHAQKTKVCKYYDAFCRRTLSNRDVFEKYEKCLENAKSSQNETFTQDDTGNVTLSHSLSAPELSPSKYFRSTSPVIYARKSESCQDLPVLHTIYNKELNEHPCELISRAPTPYPNFVSEKTNDNESSFVYKNLDITDLPKINQIPIDSMNSVTNCTRVDTIKDSVKLYEDFLGLSNYENEEVEKIIMAECEDIPSDDNLHCTVEMTVNEATLSHSSSFIEDYVEINVETTPTMLESYTTFQSCSSTSSTSGASCIQPTTSLADCSQSESTIVLESSSNSSTEIFAEMKSLSMPALLTNDQLVSPDTIAENLLKRSFSAETYDALRFSLEDSYSVSLVVPEDDLSDASTLIRHQWNISQPLFEYENEQTFYDFSSNDHTENVREEQSSRSSKNSESSSTTCIVSDDGEENDTYYI